MKTHKRILTILAVSSFILAASMTACSPTTTTDIQIQPEVDKVQNPSSSLEISTRAADVTVAHDQESEPINLDSLQTNLAGLSELSDDEIAGLLLMREEEKLAHDVYIALYETWGLAIFQNIANSEQSHTDAVKALLDAYGLEDPAAGEAPGEFVNADLQALYNELITQGSQSLSNALKVGAAIEEIDILDLEEQQVQTDDPGIRTVYENLLKGSRNHLRSFTSTLYRQTGETYQPQYLSTDVYQGIVGSSIESGGNGKGNRS